MNWKVSRRKIKHEYNPDVNPFEFEVKEDTASYQVKRAFFPYFHDPIHHIKLFQGDCIEILKRVPDNCVDLIFADPPYFLSK